MKGFFTDSFLDDLLDHDPSSVLDDSLLPEPTQNSEQRVPGPGPGKIY